MTTHPINPPPAAGEGSMSEILELTGVAEQLAEESGFWRSCSGCHECNEGVPMGDFSNVFKCHLGGGCRECGGIGAVWDNTDYSDFADFCQQLDGRQPIDTDIPEAILSKAREIYEGSWPDPTRAIAEALMEASQQWQPIETAPLDGTVVDIWAYRGECGAAGMRPGERYSDCRFVRSTYGTEPFGEPRWQGLNDRYIKVTPTHWMPLPKPPECPVDITDIARAAHPIIDAGNALIQHLKGKSA